MSCCLNGRLLFDVVFKSCGDMIDVFFVTISIFVQLQLILLLLEVLLRKCRKNIVAIVLFSILNAILAIV